MIEVEFCTNYLVLRPRGGDVEYTRFMEMIKRIDSKDRKKVNGGFAVYNPEIYTHIPVINNALEDRRRQMELPL
jgi:hypothetical protein